VSDFRELRTYQLSVRVADSVRDAVVLWPSVDRWTLGVQLIRAADSVGANIAEAYGRFSAADQRRMLYVARGSAFETEYWIARARARALPLPDRADQVSEVARALNGLIRAHRAAGLRTEN
jgi:four helix bundle protein